MNCDECAYLLEDSLYQEVDAPTEKDIAEHLSACGSCAREYTLLRREQELYVGCEAEIAPDFWSGVQARIANQNRSRAQAFAGLFNTFRFGPAVAAVTCLLIVTGSIGLWRYFATRSDRPVTAELQNAPQIAIPTTVLKTATVKPETSPPRRFVSRSASRTHAKKIEKPVLVRNEVAENKPLSAGLDADSARHLEQVEMLLRSFKNSRSLRHSNTLDLAYESDLSKDLLARNVLLRRDAELAGDVPLTRLLDQFEPFLVDIANLPDHSDSQEIDKVKERLTKAQIIAAVHSF